MDLFTLLSLLNASVTTYNAIAGKKSPLTGEETAMVDGLVTVIGQTRSILSKPEYKSVLVQEILAKDIADIRTEIGMPPAPNDDPGTGEESGKA